MTELAVYKHTFLCHSVMETQNKDEQELETTPAEESQEEEVTNDNEQENADSESESVQEESTQEDEAEENDKIDWQARAIKAEKAIEKAKKKGKTSEGGIDPEKLQRLELKAEGIKDKDDQDYILKVAKIEEVDIEEASRLDYVQDRLKANERRRQSAQATPRGNNRTNTQVDEVQSWVRKYKQNGSLPDNNPALTSKILKALKNGA